LGGKGKSRRASCLPMDMTEGGMLCHYERMALGFFIGSTRFLPYPRALDLLLPDKFNY